MTNRLIFLFSLLGLAVAVFLSYEYNFAAVITCPIAGEGCDIVRASPYSRFLGISVPYLGVAYYFTAAALSILRSQNLENVFLKRLQFLAAISAVAFGTYLTYLESAVIKAYCFWCVTSFIISIIILVFSGLSFRKRDR